MQLRPYQSKAKIDVNYSWSVGNKNVLLVMPTGAGKTVLFSDTVKDHQGYSCTMAHRQELVSQMSLSFARAGIRHRIIAPKTVVKNCVNLQMQELNNNYYDPQSSKAVASVDTLINRIEQNQSFLNNCSLWVMDEAHHVLKSNKWGKCVSLFPNAKGLGVTATPQRADGNGLGAANDGVFNDLILGPDTYDLMNMGYLSKYRVIVSETHLNLNDNDISKTTGDYKKTRLVAATEESSIIGDVVSHYLKFAAGKIGITFVPSIKIAEETAEKFNKAGVPAKALSSKNNDLERYRALRDLREGRLKQLVNVDLFGEGFDLPAIEVISIARKTMSLALHLQMIGRVLRIMEGKDKAMIIDHVGNILNPRLGLPDKRRIWTLDRRERRSKTDNEESLKVCPNPECLSPYERFHVVCPHCGFKPEVIARNQPEFVDGSLVELSDEFIQQLLGDREKIDKDKEQYRAELIAKGTPKMYEMIQVKRHAELQKTQKALRDMIAWWAGYHRAMRRCDEEIQKRFYLTFKIDILSAQSLKTKDSNELMTRVSKNLTELVKEYKEVTA